MSHTKGNRAYCLTFFKRDTVALNLAWTNDKNDMTLQYLTSPVFLYCLMFYAIFAEKLYKQVHSSACPFVVGDTLFSELAHFFALFYGNISGPQIGPKIVFFKNASLGISDILRVVSVS